MQSTFVRRLTALELEEKILNAAAFVALISVFLPWTSGEWLGGDAVTYTGFGFYTSFLGYTIFLLHFALLSITLVPLLGGPILIKMRHRELIRMIVAVQAMVLVLASLSVLTKVTFEFSRMEVRFGIYVCLIASIFALFESCVRYAGHRKTLSQEPFHHPEDASLPAEPDPLAKPLTPPPPPPPPPPAEEHRLYP